MIVDSLVEVPSKPLAKMTNKIVLMINKTSCWLSSD